MNLGVWQEDAVSELRPDVPHDQPMTMYDGRMMNPYCPMVFGIYKYNREIQFAPLADAGELTDF